MSSSYYPSDLSPPLVSVILPVYNREDSIARSINSVLKQEYRPLELIVVDDGSTDGTRKVVESFGNELKLVMQPRGGAYVARNFGLRQAQGELIALIDSDDAWFPGKLAAQVSLMSRKEVGLVYGDVIHVAAPVEGARRTGLTSFQVALPQRGHVAERFIWSNFVPTCSVLVRRSCLEEVGGFSEKNELSADFLTWFRIALRHELDYVASPVAEYTVHSKGISFDLGRAIAARVNLFSAELEQTTDPVTRRVIRRLLFNLSLHLALAAFRGRAKSVDHPLRLAEQTALRMATFRAIPWLAAFAGNQLLVRGRRLFL